MSKLSWSERHQNVYDKIKTAVDNGSNEYDELLLKALNDYMHWFDEDEIEQLELM